MSKRTLCAVCGPSLSVVLGSCCPGDALLLCLMVLLVKCISKVFRAGHPPYFDILNHKQ